MFDDLDAHFHESLVAAYTEYVETKNERVFGQSKDLRAALDAAHVLYHFREHIPEAHRKSRKDVALECPDYDLLGDLVNAVKHSEITRGAPRIMSADDLEQQLVITEYSDSKGQYRYSEKVVIAKLSDGSHRDVQEILVNVINYWMAEVERIGAGKSRKPFALPEKNVARTRAECEHASMGLAITRGLRFNAVYKLLRYNYETGIAEPVDLTGSQIQMTIRKPPSYTVALTLRNDKTGEEVTRDIELTEEESLKFHQLETDQDRIAFAQKISRLREEFGQMAREVKSRTWQGRLGLMTGEIRFAWRQFTKGMQAAFTTLRQPKIESTRVKKK